MNGAETVVAFLRDKGVDPVFGYPGGPILVLYEALYNDQFPHVLTRHEQGAAHAAEGFAKVTGKPGVVIATSGPGATNLVTGIADAILDSVPMLAITGAVARSAIGRDSFQEADITGITLPITKHNYLVMKPEELIPTLEEAWKLTTEGRPGPVLVNIPKDIMALVIDPAAENKFISLAHRPPRKRIQDQADTILHAVKKAKNPLLLAGGGVVISKDANIYMTRLAEAMRIPIATTMMGKGAVQEKHPLYMGMVGMHGTPQGNCGLANCDLLLAVGCRFSDRIIGNPDKYLQKPGRVIVHADVDPAEIGKNILPHIEVEEDAAAFFQGMLEAVERDHAKVHGECSDGLSSETCENREDRNAWFSLLDEKRSKYQSIVDQLTVIDDRLLPEAVVTAVSRAYSGRDPILVTDVGQHQMFATKYFEVESPRSFLTSGGLGTMGFGLPAALGAAYAAGERPVILFVGDGGFQMTMQELGPIQENDLPVKIVIMDNKQLGMVRQWQELFFDKHYSHSILDHNPNFVQIADAYGMKAMSAKTAEEFAAGLKAMLKDDHPFLLHVHLDEKELVYPMIPPGQNPENIIMPGMED